MIKIMNKDIQIDEMSISHSYQIFNKMVFYAETNEIDLPSNIVF